MKESRCSICRDPAARTAVSELWAQGVPQRSIASRLKIPKSSVHRHVSHSKELGASRKGGNVASSPHAGRASSGRCSSCGISVADTEPQSLLRRAERLLHGAELVVERAAADDDFRLQLQGIDRVRSALELLMKAVGLVGGDGQVTVNVDQRKLAIATLAALPAAFVERMSNGDRGALEAVLEASEMDAAASGTAPASAPGSTK